MKKMYVMYGIFIMLFCLHYTDVRIAYAWQSSGIEYGQLQRVVVEPLLGKNTWTQDDIWSSSKAASIPNFYNWYVQYRDTYHLVGCAPLATAQVLRFFEHPKTPLSLNGESIVGQDFEVTIYNPGEKGMPWDFWQGTNVTTKIIGGTGANGSYNWDLMDINPRPENYQLLSQDYPSSPLPSTTAKEHQVRHEIAALLHDLGAVLEVDYFSTNTASTFAPLIASPVYKAFTKYAGYPSALRGAFFSSTEFQTKLKTNLDNGRPVILSCGVKSTRKKEGHTFVIDGYGYKELDGAQKGDTPYFHMNLGWEGGVYQDLWYDLSSFPVYLNESDDRQLTEFFDNFIEITYNIMPDQTRKVRRFIAAM